MLVRKKVSKFWKHSRFLVRYKLIIRATMYSSVVLKGSECRQTTVIDKLENGANNNKLS